MWMFARKRHNNPDVESQGLTSSSALARNKKLSSHPSSSSDSTIGPTLRLTIAGLVFLCLLVLAFEQGKGYSQQVKLQNKMAGKRLSIATWNIAAVNNNPFEYWMTMASNPAYNKMMMDVESFIENPGSKDVAVKEVFTEEMYSKLSARLASASVPEDQLVKLRNYWSTDYSGRNIVTKFLKEKSLGSKRLASMPDRVTNTINVANSPDPVCRPTVINMYEGDLSTMDKWFEAWCNFMFADKLTLVGSSEPSTVFNMLQPIKASKYPAITPEEESLSIPLQVLACAIFDSVLVHMLNDVTVSVVFGVCVCGGGGACACACACACARVRVRVCLLRFDYQHMD